MSDRLSMRYRVHRFAGQVGWLRLLSKGRRRRRLASWLYHWGNYRLDLHKGDYAKSAAERAFWHGEP